MTPPDGPPLLVACLCAAWCGTCTDYAATFEALADEFGAAARFVRIDIEDDAAALGELDVEDFPTLLCARGDRVLFLGPVLPHAQTARQLIERALRDELPAPAVAPPAGLAGRIAALADARG
jgi:thioredoxin 1